MNTSLHSTIFPKQKLSFKQKMSLYEDSDKEWYKIATDSIINNADTYFNGNRSSYANKLENYNIYNNKYDGFNFKHLTEPFPGFALDKDKLACLDKIQPFDLVSPYFKLLLGEEVERTFEPIVAVINPDAQNEKLNERDVQIMETIQEYLASAIDPELDEESKKIKMEGIEAKMQDIGSISFRSKKEIEATHLFNAIKHMCKVNNEFIKGHKDQLLASEEFYRIGEIGNQPYIKRVNPLRIYAEFENDDYRLSKATKICEWERMPISKVIDEFYEYLEPDEINKLEDQFIEHPRMTLATSPTYNPSVVDNINQLRNSSQPGVDVYRTTWKSMLELCIFTYMDENGESHTEIHPETFKKPNQFYGEIVEKFWISEYWHCIRINDDIYINPGPNKSRFGNSQNLSECSSGYAGTVYEADNSVSVSTMDRLKPWIYLYISTWFNLEELLKQNRGNLPTIDIAMIPDGWEPEKWMYYASKLGYSFGNSFNEGKKGQATGKLAGNLGHSGNQTINLDKGNAIQAAISVLNYIENRVGFTAGIPPQRLGEIKSQELVGNTERVVHQSSYTTQYLVYQHNQTKLEALELLINVAKDSLSENQILQYMTDDSTITMHKMTQDLGMTDIGLYLTNNPKDLKSQEIMRSLLENAVASDKIEMSEVASVLNSNSTAEIERKLKKADAIRRQASQQAQQLEQQKIESNERMALEQMNREDMNKQLDRENKIHIAEITVMSRQKDMDINQNAIPDTSEMASRNLEMSRLAFDMAQAEKQNNQDETDQRLKQADLQLKKRKQDIDYELAKEKIAVDRIKANKTSKKSNK